MYQEFNTSPGGAKNSPFWTKRGTLVNAPKWVKMANPTVLDNFWPMCTFSDHLAIGAQIDFCPKNTTHLIIAHITHCREREITYSGFMGKFHFQLVNKMFKGSTYICFKNLFRNGMDKNYY